MFVFARGVPLNDPDIILENACYAGPEAIARRSQEKFVVRIGDPDAAFATLSFDIATGDIEIESDLSGQLALRHHFTEGGVYVSSHDIALSPYVPFDVDEVSLANIRSVGWSLGGHSLIRGISVCAPGAQVRISNVVRTDELTHPPLGSVEDATTAAIDYLGARLPAGRVTVELSAGFDSRAALAATLACKDAADIDVFSEGPEDSLDVTIARDICRRCGIAFERRETRERDAQELLEDWSEGAALNNGHLEINVLASRGAPSVATVVCGDGGEIHRGYYYPYRPFQRLLPGKQRDALDVLAARFGRSDRLASSVSRLSAWADSDEEILDLFYLTERFGIWNQKLARDRSERISPFFARKSMVGLGSGRDSALHVGLIERYLPQALTLPINGEAPPCRYKDNLVSKARLESAILAGKLARRFSRKGDLQDSRAAVMAKALTTLPEDFLHGEATTWADYGARRFLRMYKNESTSKPVFPK